MEGTQAARNNTDTRSNPKDYYEPYINHHIAIYETGGDEAFNHFMKYLQQVSELRREERMGGNILELQTLMRGQDWIPIPQAPKVFLVISGE